MGWGSMRVPTVGSVRIRKERVERREESGSHDSTRR